MGEEEKKLKIFWNKRVINHKIIFLKMIIQRRKVPLVFLCASFMLNNISISLFSLRAGESFTLRLQELRIQLSLGSNEVVTWWSTIMAWLLLVRRKSFQELSTSNVGVFRWKNRWKLFIEDVLLEKYSTVFWFNWNLTEKMKNYGSLFHREGLKTINK